MPTRYPSVSPSAVSGLVLSCLLLGGCASEKALLAQTQPLQDQIAHIEQTLAASGAANARALKAQEVRNLQAESRLNAMGESLAARISGMEKNLNGVADLANKTAQQTARSQVRQEADAAINAAIAARVGNDERRLAVVASNAQQMSLEMARQTDALKSRQDAASLASSALDARMNLAEQRLNTLSGLVQEALALAAKDIFLANGKEAFTVLLTDDKVLYPQNDPALDSRDAAKLDELTEKLGKLDQEYHLDIQGHTANNSTEDNNYYLGKARAEVVKRYLHEKKGISINRMSTISYGANKPLYPAGGDNRRIFIRVLVLQ